MDAITSRLIKLREDNGLTKIEMAKKIGINKSTITRYETGEMKPTLDVLIKIKQTFGVSLDWLAGFDTNEIAEYGSVITECVETNITPSDLSDAVNFMKRQRKE